MRLIFGWCVPTYVSFLEKGRCPAPDLSRMNEEKCIVRNHTINGLSEWLGTQCHRLIFHCVSPFSCSLKAWSKFVRFLVLDSSSGYVPMCATLPFSITTIRSICGRSARLCVTKIRVWKTECFISWVTKKNGKNNLF